MSGDVIIKHDASKMTSVQFRELMIVLTGGTDSITPERLDKIVEHGFVVNRSMTTEIISDMVQAWYYMTHTDGDTAQPIGFIIHPVMGPDTLWDKQKYVRLSPPIKDERMYDVGNGIFAMTLGNPEDIDMVLRSLLGEPDPKKHN